MRGSTGWPAPLPSSIAVFGDQPLPGCAKLRDRARLDRSTGTANSLALAANLIIASAALLVLLLAPDAYTALVLVFDLVAIVGLAGALFRPSLRRPAPSVALGVRP